MRLSPKSPTLATPFISSTLAGLRSLHAASQCTAEYARISGNVRKQPQHDLVFGRPGSYAGGIQRCLPLSACEPSQRASQLESLPVHDGGVHVPQCCSHVQPNSQGVPQGEACAAALLKVQNHLGTA